MTPAPDAARDPAASAALSRRLEMPREIGPYKVLSTLGAGGMGVVFLARQERPSRTVALKVIHGSVLSHRTMRRFEQEAEVLARLHHPGIAQVYQVGTYATPQGELPYIAMEYVEGERLDAFVARARPDLAARLALFAHIADAVEHAHQKGVIHRDLKPGNILVTADGSPKVLDFGVARLADDDTRTTTLRTDVGALLGTLTYMSPEQASGDPQAVDARADVYSLGVLLYELLTGKLPYALDRFALPEAVRVIREEEPTKISTHDRSLRGDVDTIVRKTLEKDRERRYGSAQALADDVRRFLADEPIQARPPSALYQLAKFGRRNKILVGGIAAVFLTSVVGAGLSTHLWLRERASSARERESRLLAEGEEKRAAAAADFLLSLFSGLGPEVAQGADTRLLRQVLEEARGRLASELADHPAVEADIRATLGAVYVDLSLPDEAQQEYERALELRRALYGPDDRRVLDVEHGLATLQKRRGEFAEAEAALRANLARQTEALGARDRDTLRSRSALGDSLMRQGRYREAEETLRAALAQQVELLGDADEDTLATRMVLAQTLGFESKAREAHELVESVFLERSTRHGDDHPTTIITLATLSSTLREIGALEEAEETQRDALERATRVLGADDQQTLAMVNNLHIILDMAGRTDEAEEVLRDCLARRERVLGPEHADTLNTRNNLANLLSKYGRMAEAEPLILETLATTERALGESHRETVRARNAAAILYGRQGKHREAAALLEVVVRLARANLGADDPALALDLYNWAATLQNAGDQAAAEPILREVLELVERHGLASERYVPAAENALGKALEARGARAEADEHFQRGLAERRARHGAFHPETAYSLNDYGDALLERGEAAAAEPLLAELVRIEERLARGGAELAQALSLHGRALAALGRRAEAEARLVAACERLATLPDAKPGLARSTRQALLDLYAAWDAAEPDPARAARAARWQTPLPAE